MLIPLAEHLYLPPAEEKLPEAPGMVIFDIHKPEPEPFDATSLVDGIWAIAQEVCPEFVKAIHGDYYYMHFKSWEMLSMWKSRCFKPQRADDQNPESDGEPTLIDVMQAIHWGEGSGIALEVLFSDPEHLPEQVESLEWQRIGVYRHESWDWDEEIWNGKRLPFTLRLPLGPLFRNLASCELLKNVYCVHEFSKLLNEDFETLLDRELRPEDRMVFLEGQSLKEELGLIWKPERITIV